MVVNGVSFEWEVFHNQLPVILWLVVGPYSVSLLSQRFGLFYTNITMDIMKSVSGNVPVHFFHYSRSI